MYHIQPNYHTVHLDFSKLLNNKLVVKYPPYKGTVFMKDQQRTFMRSVFNDAYAILFSDFLYKSMCCVYSFELLACRSKLK